MTHVFMEHDDMIDKFDGDYAWLSNFYPVVVHLHGINFPTVEHAFVAAKTKNYMDRMLIAAMDAKDAGKAKIRGRKFELRDDWEEVKVSIMRQLLMQKFSYAELRKKLLATGDRTLLEGNYWHDNFWGSCFCDRQEACKYHGKNMLGKLIMEVRDIIK